MMTSISVAPSIKGYPIYDDKQYYQQIKNITQNEALFNDHKDFNIAKTQNNEDKKLK